MRRVLAVLAAATLLSTQASAIVTRHDVDKSAYDADEADFPALASLYSSPDGRRDCVATLIAPDWVITAKHCVADDALDARIAAGEFAITFAEGREAIVTRIERMPDLEGPVQRSDIALLQLASPIEDIEPVPFYEGGDELGRVMFFAGWGGTGTGIEGVSSEDGAFRIAENRVDSVFDNFLVFRFDDPRTHLDRALPLEGISGPGDSGGPALVPTPHGCAIAGISSAQRTYDAKEGTYNVDEYYVRISAAREWIDSVIDG